MKNVLNNVFDLIISFQNGVLGNNGLNVQNPVMEENVNVFENVSMALIVRVLQRNISCAINNLVLSGASGPTGLSAVPLVEMKEPSFEHVVVCTRDFHPISAKERLKISRLVNSTSVHTGMNGPPGQLAQQLAGMGNKQELENVYQEGMDAKEEIRNSNSVS